MQSHWRTCASCWPDCGVRSRGAIGGCVCGARSPTLYFIDVEGGQSTLIVSPSGESLLIDTGYQSDGRDAARIVAAMRDAGVTQIDHLLLTHFHMDHMGGLSELAPRVPVKRFYDHDTLADRSDPPVVAAFADYQRLRTAATHVIPAVGSALPIPGLDVQWVSSDGRVIASARKGGGQPTSACPPSSPPPGEPLENPRSTGFFLSYGAFRFVDLGDISGEPLYRLVCPCALLGPVDLFLVPHHGGNDTGYPAVLNAFKPRAALINSPAFKGRSPPLRRSAGARPVERSFIARRTRRDERQ